MDFDYIANSNKNFIDICKFNNKPFRSKLIFSKVWNDLDNVKNDIHNLKKYFKRYRTDILTVDPKTKIDTITIGGFYTPQTNRIELILGVDDFDKHEFNFLTWYQFKFMFIQVLCHELIHMMQFSNREFFWSYRNCKYKKVKCKNKNDSRKYHSNLDEIEAYAHCIYLELIQFNVPIPKSKDNIDTFKLSPTFNMILRVFGNKAKEDAIRKTIFHIRKWHKRYNT